MTFKCGEAILELLWPTRCAVCDAPGTLLCETCFERLPFIDAWQACPRCGSPYGKVICTECSGAALEAKNWEAFPFDGLVSSLTLDDQARRIATLFKDHDEQRLSTVMAFIMARYLPPTWCKAAPVLTHIPASQKAFLRRGFDHAEVLVKELSRLTQLPWMPVFERPETRDQRTLSKQGRQQNLEGSFRLKPSVALHNDEVNPTKHASTTPKRSGVQASRLPSTVIIIDDVCTTGATLKAAADALRAAGCATIFALTFAHA